jgi:UPF0176 protein
VNVASFYRFTDVSDPDKLRGRLQVLCESNDLLGTVLVANEGVNGTVAGSEKAVQSVLDWLQDSLSLAEPIEGRWAEADEAPFRRMRVKVKREIVTLGRPDIRPDKLTGKYVGVDEWNALISAPETLVIDTRNQYEFEVGTFKNAVDPETDSFREFPKYAEKLAETDPDRPLAMFCTGGIRCEKATALMLELGFNEVYHLQGGILKYLEDVDGDDNLWSGECFVFDTRVAVDRDRAEGGYVQCHACRRPLSSEDLESPDYREGVSCPKCIGTLDAERAARLEERRKQVALAKERGEEHIGAHRD